MHTFWGRVFPPGAMCRVACAALCRGEGLVGVSLCRGGFLALFWWVDLGVWGAHMLTQVRHRYGGGCAGRFCYVGGGLASSGTFW